MSECLRTGLCIAPAIVFGLVYIVWEWRQIGRLEE